MLPCAMATKDSMTSYLPRPRKCIQCAVSIPFLSFFFWLHFCWSG